MMMQPKQTLKTLNIIYIALFMGQILFFVVAYYLNFELERAEETDNMFEMIVPIVVIGAIGASYWLYNQRKLQGQKLEGIVQKVGHYRVSNILRFALVEAGNMFALIAFLMTGSNTFLVFFALGMAVFLFYRPSKNGFTNDYNLTGVEKNEL